MRIGRLAAVAALSALATLSIPGAVTASTITSISTFSLPGPSTGSITPGVTAAPNNDNADGTNPNVVTATIFYNALGPADIEFVVGASGGTTEYRFSELLVDTTGVPWEGFDFELGFGTGVDFVPLAAAIGLDFDDPDSDPAAFSPFFPTVVRSLGSLKFSGATLPGVIGVPFTFAIDVPDGIAAISPTGESRFTLRQTPVPAKVVPEPGSLALMATALGGVLWRRRRSFPKN